MTPDQLNKRYDSGQITAIDFAAHVIRCIDSTNVNSILKSLPPEVLSRVREIVVKYDPDRLIPFGNAQPPSRECVALLEQWFRRFGITMVDSTS